MQNSGWRLVALVVDGIVATLMTIVMMALVPMFISANVVVIYHALTLRRQWATTN